MKKGTHIFIIAVFIFIVVAVWGNSLMSISNNKVINSEIKVSMERLDSSVKNDDGETMAVIYYDMPVIEGGIESTLKINKFFENECMLWLSASCRLNYFHDNRMKKFLDRLEEMRMYWGDEVIEVQPFVYKVDSKVVLLNDDILSIKQTIYTLSDTSSGTLHFGSTFDLNT